MKRSVWVTSACLLIVIGLTLWYLMAEEQDTPHQQARVLEETAKTAVANPKKVLKVTHKAQKEQQEELFNPYENEEIKEAFQQVSDAYEESIKYPIGSQPIRSPDEVREYEEFEQSEVDLPFPTDENDKNPIRIIAATNTYQYFQGDTIVVRVQITGAPLDTFIDVSGLISGTNGDVPLDAAFQPNGSTQSTFTASFDTSVIPANLLTQEMLAKVTVNIDGRDLATTVAFRYAVASAQVIGVQPATPQGPELVIPLQVNVFQAGYYFVSAVLEDAATGRPLVQLQQEGRLDQGNGILELKAHITALRQQDSEGPYVLRSVRIYRGAEIGESFDAPASVAQARFAVQGFPFSYYDDEEYVDELALERLEFLRDLGSVDEEQARARQQELEEQERLEREQPSLSNPELQAQN